MITVAAPRTERAVRITQTELHALETAGLDDPHSEPSMKTYLIITGSLFGLLAVAHVWRIIGEWPRLMHDPGEIIEAGVGLLRVARRP